MDSTLETEIIFDETNEQELESDEIELNFQEWLKLDLKKRIESFHELSLEDQHKSFPLIPANEKINLMNSYEKKLYESIKSQKYLPGTIFVDYLKTSEYSLDSLLQGNKIVSRGKGGQRSKVIRSSRTTGGSSCAFNFYTNSSDSSKGAKAYKCVIQFYPDHSINGNSSRLLDYIFSENKKLFKPNSNLDGCRVACSCSDFFYTYSEVNSLRGCKAGKRPDIKKTSTHSRNSSQLAGCCKHITASFDFLKMYSLIE